MPRLYFTESLIVKHYWEFGIMPTYVYKCKKCGKVFEYDQRITEDALTTCPVEICEQEIKGFGEVERKISANIGLDFRGSGFYLTDYANKHCSNYSSVPHAHTSDCSSCEQNHKCVNK